MSTAPALNALSTDEAFYHKRKLYVMYPLISFPFLAVLFYLMGGGRISHSATESAETASPMGFNVSMPAAQDVSYRNRKIDAPSYERADGGQVLSDFTNARKGTQTSGLRSMPVDNETAPVNESASNPTVTTAVATANPATGTSTTRVRPTRGATALRTSRANRRGATPTYQYRPPQPYYERANQSDQQMEKQLMAYQNSRSAAPSPSTGRTELATPKPATTEAKASVELAENVTASRMGEGVLAPESPFHSAPIGTQSQTRTSVLSSSTNRRSVAKLIPVVIHDDQTVRAGQTVKLRLTKDIVVDGITVPANTLLHAVCSLDGNRVKLAVQNVQWGTQLIPLDLEVYDLDGLAGINAPGVLDAIKGQMKSSALSGVMVPTNNTLLNAVVSTARMGASQAVREPTIRLKGGYHLYLKSL